ncbi:MAG: PEGA domain-containing protein [Myxococcales bacterium]|nr:PEGA domain-containing protein [Myxococcales bacterium]
MPACLLILLLAPDALLWRFQGPEASSLQAAAVAAQQAGGLSGHLLTPEAVDQHLASVDPAGARQPALLGCLADRQVCADPVRAGLALAGLAGRIDARTSRTEAGYVATLELVPADPTAAPRTYTGAGPSAGTALTDAISALEGQGTIEVEVEPADARLLLDGKPLGTGAGRYPAPPGRHRLRAEADGLAPLEMTVEVRAGEIAPVRMELGNGYGQLILRLTPADATATLDGQPVAQPAEARDLAPGEYRLHVEAEGYQAHDQTVSIKPSTLVTLTVGLAREQDDWLRRFQSPHPDTLAYPLQLHADLRFVSIGAGPLDVSRDGAGGKVEYDRLDDAVGLLGIGLGVGWRGRHLLVDALTLTFEGGGGQTPATLATGEDDHIDSLSRITVRPGWVGLRYPAWRLSPFFAGGIQFSFESLEVTNDAGKTEELSKSALLLGLTIGLEAQITPEWSGTVAGVVDFGFDARTAATFVVGVGYAFETPGLF